MPCAWCASNKLSECSALHGIESVPESDAFDFAFNRIEKPVLVDTSKSVEWAENFCKGQFDTRLIHLLRDPRGYYSSQRRRVPVQAWDSLIPHWIEENARIATFLAASRLPHKVAIYDQLAQNPSAAFGQLFEFLDLAPESSALRYWEKAHHAFAGNGASSLMLGDFPESRTKSIFITGDDSFYSEQGKRNFHDIRWIQNLSAEEKTTIENNAEVVRLLKDYGFTMSADGLR